MSNIKPCSPAKPTKKVGWKLITKKASKLDIKVPTTQPKDDDKYQKGIATPITQASASTVGYESARESPGMEYKETPRKRCGSEGDALPPLPLTSTPEVKEGPRSIADRPRSESALLRIKAQLRAAAAADLESSVQAAEEPKDSEEGNDSLRSVKSAVGSCNFYEIPRMANTLLQDTKRKLEESRNLSREIRDGVIEGLHGLHEMILRLADSRNLHIVEKERLKAGYERRLSQLEARQAAACRAQSETITKTQHNIVTKIQDTFKETEAVRYLAYELEKQGKETKRTIDHLVERLSGSRTTTNSDNSDDFTNPPNSTG